VIDVLPGLKSADAPLKRGQLLDTPPERFVLACSNRLPHHYFLATSCASRAPVFWSPDLHALIMRGDAVNEEFRIPDLPVCGGSWGL
jgi:hypothetical protein